MNRDETINNKISECYKLAQRNHKTRHDWVEKVTAGNCARSFNLTIQTEWCEKLTTSKIIIIIIMEAEDVEIGGQVETIQTTT